MGGVYGFENGHILLWTNAMEPRGAPVYSRREELKERLGEEGRPRFIVKQRRATCACTPTCT